MARMASREPGGRDVKGAAGAAEADFAAYFRNLGMVVVPMKPSMDQIIAATAAAKVSVEEAWRVYTAMLAASDVTRLR